VLHPVVDACFELRGRKDSDPGFDPRTLREIRVRLHPVALAVTDRRQPSTRTEGQVSVHHWSAVALALGKAGLPEGDLPVLRDPQIAALRERVRPVPDDALARDEAEVTVVLDSGATLASTRHKGCAPMSDDALAAKFRAQALLVFPPQHVEQFAGRDPCARGIRRCRCARTARGAAVTTKSSCLAPRTWL
jgi:2-methylcitrate dehydratase PrpD